MGIIGYQTSPLSPLINLKKKINLNNMNFIISHIANSRVILEHFKSIVYILYVWFYIPQLSLYDINTYFITFEIMSIKIYRYRTIVISHY